MFQQAFASLDQYLFCHRQYWQFMPFRQDSYPWDNHPLSNWLKSLTDDDVASFEEQPDMLTRQSGPHLPWFRQADGWLDISSRTSQISAPFWLTNGIKGRKWQQISHFAAQCATKQGRIVEWCAGKGHLGRLLGWQQDKPVLSIEWQAGLCEQGREESDRQGLRQEFLCADVLAQDLRDQLRPDQQLVALHACGQLHIRMLQLAVEQRIGELCLCPCCYQLIEQEVYQPLSGLAQDSELRLSRQELRLAVQETVTAPKRDRQKRLTERRYRLIFDSWQREATGQDCYLPVPSAPDALFRQNPVAFCAWAAAQKGLTGPEERDLARHVQQAEQKLGMMARLELVQHLFRRHLELWLVLDRCLYLEEAGYRVELTEFCSRSVTPRNLLIRAFL
ncbi:methyltransferase [Bowmanella dokdonensis]|uniref:Methyltransferase n=1 Tax=Bowmanella dokdonensis TaxID=751969 RepID=A0A939DNX6_9ALTE|nr:methyltransferase [Bowmanella dokdonensis]MBN7826117.1 methyltransferase [Bowmanella dokdonensis]